METIIGLHPIGLRDSERDNQEEERGVQRYGHSLLWENQFLISY